MGILRNDAGNAAEVADEGGWGGVLDVPAEGDALLHAHEGNAGGGANHKQGATSGSTVADEVPQVAVGWVSGEVVHALGGRHQRDVVDNGIGLLKSFAGILQSVVPQDELV